DFTIEFDLLTETVVGGADSEQALGVIADGIANDFIQVSLNQDNQTAPAESTTMFTVRRAENVEDRAHFEIAEVYDGQWHRHRLHRSGASTSYELDGQLVSLDFHADALDSDNLDLDRVLAFAAR